MIDRDVRRMEALPLEWYALTDSQRAAVSVVSAMLVDALDALAKKDHAANEKNSRRQDESKPPVDCIFRRVLDRDRHSQIAFIDGDRGTGKSSVLLTLMDMTQTRSFSFDKPEEYSGEALPDDVHATGLRRSGCRLVWLETLDMEPLSRGTNLFAAILARITQVLDHGMGEIPPIAAALGDPDGYADVVARVQQLQNDAAIIWERLDGGGHGADPQTRALWVTRTEKAGLDLNRRIGEVLEGVARLLRTRAGGEFLFVLPVDDFDLAPVHCLELLRLIRMITTPRLFFLVAGNTRIAESVIKLRAEGDLLELAAKRPADPGEVQERAVEIAANNMRKLVPPGQRARLAELRVPEALALAGGSLRETLGAVSFEANQAPTGSSRMSFLRFLLLDDRDRANGSTSAGWLAGTPRQVLDCQEMLARHVRLDKNTEMSYEDADRLLATLLEEIRRQVREDWRLPYPLRERLAAMLDIGVNGGLEFEDQVRIEQKDSGGFIEQQFEYGLLLRYAPGIIRAFIPIGREVASGQERWQERYLQKESRMELPRRLAAGILLSHDLAVALWGTYLRHSSLTYGVKVGPKMVALWGNSSKDAARIVWPTPEWWTFRDYERFALHWRLHSIQCDGQHGRAWLAAMLEVVLDEVCEPGAVGLASQRLTDFLQRLVVEQPTRTARRVLRASGLVAAALLFAPEYVSGLDLQQFLETDSSFGQAILESSIKDRVRVMRAGNLARVLKSDHRPIDANAEAALCAVIAPTLGWERFKRLAVNRLQSQSRAGARDPAKLQGPEKTVREAADFIDQLQDLISVDELMGLNEIRSALAEIEIIVGPVPEVDWLIRIGRSALNPNFFNTHGESAFVPTAEDIELAR